MLSAVSQQTVLCSIQTTLFRSQKDSNYEFALRQILSRITLVRKTWTLGVFYLKELQSADFRNLDFDVPRSHGLCTDRMAFYACMDKIYYSMPTKKLGMNEESLPSVHVFLASAISSSQISSSCPGSVLHSYFAKESSSVDLRMFKRLLCRRRAWKTGRSSRVVLLWQECRRTRWQVNAWEVSSSPGSFDKSEDEEVLHPIA